MRFAATPDRERDQNKEIRKQYQNGSGHLSSLLHECTQ